MKRPNLRIRVQLTVSVCLFTLICLVSLAIAICVLSRSTLLTLEIGNVDLHSRMLREECRQEFDDMYESFLRLSYSSPVRDIYADYNSSTVLKQSANLLHDSFGADRILLMKLYLANGTEVLEIDSKAFGNRSGLPQSLFPLNYAPASDLSRNLRNIQQTRGEFIGPVKAAEPIGGSDYMISLTLPIRNDTSPKGVLSSNQTLGFAAFLINAQRIERILSTKSLSSSAIDVGAASLCAARDNFTMLDQLIPFNNNRSEATTNTTSERVVQSLNKMKTTDISASYAGLRKRSTASDEIHYLPSDEVYVPQKMVVQLAQNQTPTAEYNKGPDKSMISISPLTILNSTYYVVVLQSHRRTFLLPHRLRNIVILTSCIIGAVMIIFTFLFVSFGARQILRLKMAATYEQPAPSKWKFLPLPWWLRPSNRKVSPNTSDRAEMQVPENVPLRKHVRDELDDITERFNAMSSELRKQCRRLEDRVAARKAEIEQAREAADLANAAKSHFLARVTHELRNPLNGIIGTATLCLEEDNVDNIHNSLKTIFKCGELLLNLMVDLLSFSKTEVENLHLESRDFTLAEITAQLQVIFTEQCSARQIGLVVQRNEQFNNYVFSGDTNRILQVIFNLMSNGIKFTPEGGRVQLNADVSSTDEYMTVWEDVDESDEVEIDVDDLKKATSSTDDDQTRAESETTCSPNDTLESRIIISGERQKRRVRRACRTLRFEVCDNGPGIAPELQARVFEEFVQGDISPHVKRSGVGLGLCICRQLAERMNGSVTLHSQVGCGSTFTFQVPLPYRVIDPETSKATGADVLELTSYASMLRIAESKPSDDDDSKGSAKSKSEEPSTEAEPKPEKDAIKNSRNLFPSAHRTRELLLRRRTSDVILKSADLESPTTPSKRFILSRSSASEASSEKSDRVSPWEKSSSEKSPQVPQQSSHENSPVVQPYSPTLKPGISDIHTHTATAPPLLRKSSYLGKPSPDLRVLVVDDNSVNQEVMMRMLKLEGLKNIKVANDGKQALDRVKEASDEGAAFDVIFMDVQMPNMDGREATRIIRTEMKMTVPIVAVSAFANETNAHDCIQAGMNLFLSKPLRRPHLREILLSVSNAASSDDSTPEEGL